MLDPGGVADPGASPFGHEGVEGGNVLVQRRGPLDDEVIGPTGPEAAVRAGDEDVSPGAAEELAPARTGDEHVAGAAAAGVEDAVAVTSHHDRRDADAPDAGPGS